MLTPTPLTPKPPDGKVGTRRWICVVCGWIYDEALGVPDGGISPGTAFEEVPDLWVCPRCGVGKADFDFLDSPPG